MKKDLYFPYLAVVGIVAIVALVSLVLFNGGLEGAPTFEERADEYARICEDDEPASDWFIAGTVTAGAIEYHDYCRNGKLYQFFCKHNEAALSRGYDCPNGCLNGVCINN